MTAGEVIQSLARAPFDAEVLIDWPGGPRFTIDRIELSTRGKDEWEVTVTPDLGRTVTTDE